MKKSIEMLQQGFVSSSGTTEQFKEFKRVFSREFRRELKELGCTDIKISQGHFYLSDFFTSKTGQPYYFSISDVRSNPTNLLYRKVKDYKDYTGGSNCYVSLDSIKKHMYLR